MGGAVRYTRAGIEGLQTLAEKQAGQNGHKLGKWRLSQYGDNFISYAYCKDCWSNVIVDTKAEDVVIGSALRSECDLDKIPF